MQRPCAVRERRGAAAVEFALVAPVFLILLAGIVEFGQTFQIEHSLANACRRGARSAVTQGTTSAAVKQEVKTHCAKLLGVAETDVTVLISRNGTANAEISGAAAGDEIEVKVQLAFSKAAIGFFSKTFGNGTLTSSSIAERE